MNDLAQEKTYIIPVNNSINLEIPPARFPKGSSLEIRGRKKSMPASIDSTPKDKAICIHILFLEGARTHMRPDMRIGHPIIAGIQAVIDFESISNEVMRAHTISNAPNNMVRLGIEKPANVNCFSKIAFA
tara:strand:+ start:32 stop:421 length:390 start_codon:yes stop_codon:yes gene_type:complete